MYYAMNFDPHVHVHVHTQTYTQWNYANQDTERFRNYGRLFYAPSPATPWENVLEIILGTCNYVVWHELPYIINRNVISDAFN